MKIYTNYYDEHRTEKPTKPETGTICNECSRPKYIDTEELLNILLHGGTTLPCAINGTHAYQFVSGQLFFVDVDNEDRHKNPLPEEQQLKPEEALKLSLDNGLHPIVIYYSFSSTEDCPRYRIGFVADRPITNFHQWEYCQKKIFGLFPIDTADFRTNNANRLFFGTNKGLFYKDLTATVSVDDLLSGYTEPQERTTRSTTATSTSELIFADDSIVDAIKNHDADYIRKALHRDEPIVFDNRDDFYRYVYQKISIAELLNVPPRKAFVCVFPENHKHGDTETPSASVFKSFHGVWMYSCKGEGFCINIKQLIEKLGKFKSEFQSWEFIKSAFNISIRETAWSIEQKQNLDMILNCLSRNDDFGFANLCPTANYNLRYCTQLLKDILTLAKDSILPDQWDGDNSIVFFMPASRLKSSKTTKNETAIRQWMRVLCYHEILINVPVDQVPEPLRKKAQIYKAKSDIEHFPNFYKVPSWVCEQLDAIESRGIEYKSRGYRRKSFTYEGMLRSEGRETALKLFPEYAYCTDKKTGEVVQRGTTKTADRHQDILMEVITDAITEKGFTTEAEVLDRASVLLRADAQRMNRKPNNNISGRYTAQKQLFNSLNDIMDANNLVKVRCNKSLKAKYNIGGTGYPVIITIKE